MNNKFFLIFVKLLGWILVFILCFITFIFVYEIANNKFNLNNYFEYDKKRYVLVNLNEDIYFKINSNAINHRVMQIKSNDLNNSTSEDKTTDIVSNAMAAVGTSVAALTLIFSLGIPFFLNMLEKVKTSEKQSKNILNEINKELTKNKKLINLQNKLVIVKNKLLDWAIESSDANSGISFAQRIGFYLEFLQSEDDDVRFNAFEELIDLPLLVNSELDNDKLFIKDLIDYQNACHDYVCTLKQVPEWLFATTTNIWCKFFSEIEKTCFEEQKKLKYSKVLIT